MFSKRVSFLFQSNMFWFTRRSSHDKVWTYILVSCMY